MRKAILMGITILMPLGIMAGCAGNNELVKTMSNSTTQGVSQGVQETLPEAHGYVNLNINSSLKTHSTGSQLVKDIHGTPDYALLLNIDGQTVLLRGNLQTENREPRGLSDTEDGDGIRYRFSKSLRLKAGTHRIVVAIPDDGIVVERYISLIEGNDNNLVLEPIYKSTSGMRRPGAGSTTSFKNGIRDIRLTLNGRDV